MKIKYTCLLVITCSLFFLTACASLSTSPPSPVPTTAPTPTQIPYSKDDFRIAFDIEFEDRDNLRVFSALGTISEDGDQQVTNNDVVLEDGVVTLGAFPVRGLNFNTMIPFNEALHLRWKITKQNTCLSLMMTPLIRQDELLTGINPVGVGDCANADLVLKTQEQYSETENFLPQTYGQIHLTENKWIDSVLWIEENEIPALYLVAWETEHPEIYYVEKRALENWQEANGFMFSPDVFEGEIAMDSMKKVSGDIESYLWFNSPVFQTEIDQISSVFSEPFAEVAIAELPEDEGTVDEHMELDSIFLADYDNEVETVFASMAHSEDFPDTYRVYQNIQEIAKLPEEYRLSTNFFEFKKGLWFTTDIRVQDCPYASQEEFIEDIEEYNPKAEWRKEVPQVGDFSAQYFSNQFERYSFAKNNIRVDLLCNSVWDFSGYHPFCTSENMSEIAAKIYDRLPDEIALPEKLDIYLPQAAEDQYFSDIWVFDKRLYWKAKTWLPEMRLVLYCNNLDEYTLVSDLVEIRQGSVGNGEANLGAGMLPGNSEYTLFVIVDNKLVKQIHFVQEEYK